MQEKERLIEFIEKEPELLKIIESKEHIDVLLKIFEKPPKIEELKTKTSFKNVSILYNILDALIHSKLIKKIEVGNEEVYYVTDKGEEFVKTYKVSKEKFDLNGGE